MISLIVTAVICLWSSLISQAIIERHILRPTQLNIEKGRKPTCEEAPCLAPGRKLVGRPDVYRDNAGRIKRDGPLKGGVIAQAIGVDAKELQSNKQQESSEEPESSGLFGIGR